MSSPTKTGVDSPRLAWLDGGFPPRIVGIGHAGTLVCPGQIGRDSRNPYWLSEEVVALHETDSFFPRSVTFRSVSLGSESDSHSKRLRSLLRIQVPQKVFGPAAPKGIPSGLLLQSQADAGDVPLPLAETVTRPGL